MYNIVILTGAGISAESEQAVSDEGDSILNQYEIFDIAQPEVFKRDPALVHEHYNARRKYYRKAIPNSAHCALKCLEALRPAGKTLTVTMNVDDLHERAGSKNVWHIHGEISRARCAKCDHRWDAPEVMSPEDLCPSCGEAATRPDIVWFGETPCYLEEIHARLRRAHLFVQIGSSGTVSPANYFVNVAQQAGVRTLALNLDTPANFPSFDEFRRGKASEIVPEWVEEMLRQPSRLHALFMIGSVCRKLCRRISDCMTKSISHARRLFRMPK